MNKKFHYAYAIVASCIAITCLPCALVLSCAAGLAAGTTGIVLLCVGNGNLKKIVRTCDAAGLPPVEIAFGPAPSGVGLTLRF